MYMITLWEFVAGSFFYLGLLPAISLLLIFYIVYVLIFKWERKPNMTHDEYERAFEGTYTCPFMSESENKNLEGSEVNWR